MLHDLKLHFQLIHVHMLCVGRSYMGESPCTQNTTLELIWVKNTTTEFVIKCIA